MHDTNALSDAKIEKLIMKYGVEGYGLYFACVEIIAGNLTNENITFELEHDAEILGHKFQIDTLKVNDMMGYMIALGLFEINQITKRVSCEKLAKRISSNLIKNPQLLKIKKEIQEDMRSNEKTQEVMSQTKLDYIILDNNKEKEKKKDSSLSLITDILNCWTDNGLAKHSLTTIQNNIKPKELKILKSYPVDVLKGAIANYATVCQGEGYFWTWDGWTLLQFISRGLINFLDEADPLTRFKAADSEAEEDKKYDDNLKKLVERVEKEEAAKKHGKN